MSLTSQNLDVTLCIPQRTGSVLYPVNVPVSDATVFVHGAHSTHEWHRYPKTVVIH